jgi:F-type H+-transporting ATPase subunit delta
VTGQEPIVAGMAGRYATALFELAQNEGAIQSVEQDLQNLESLVATSADLLRLIRSPVFSAAEQADAIGAVLEKMGVQPLTAKFVGLVAKNRRLFALRDMIKAYLILTADHRGEMTAEVTSSHALSDTQVTELRQTLHQKYARDVNLKATVDESLLGGLIVKVGSRMVDTSLKTKLNNLRIAMKEA